MPYSHFDAENRLWLCYAFVSLSSGPSIGQNPKSLEADGDAESALLWIIKLHQIVESLLRSFQVKYEPRNPNPNSDSSAGTTLKQLRRKILHAC